MPNGNSYPDEHRATMEERVNVESAGFERVRGFLLSQPDIAEARDVREDPAYRIVDVDLVVITHRGDISTVELKVEPKADITRNFAFEVVSNESKGSPGCFMYTEADWLYSYLPGADALYKMPMPQTREWFLRRLQEDPCPFNKFGTNTTSRAGKDLYRTLFYAVPIEVVLREVNLAFEIRLSR